jgi:hypothetical protein
MKRRSFLSTLAALGLAPWIKPRPAIAAATPPTIEVYVAVAGSASQNLTILGECGVITKVQAVSIRQDIRIGDYLYYDASTGQVTVVTKPGRAC